MKQNIKTKWDPLQYLKFSAERFRPALDLIDEISLDSPRLIYDLGCGTGHVSKILADRWPTAKIVGIDSSEEMLAAAKKIDSTIQWRHEDINTWKANDDKPDLIFSNSTLHWLKDHETVFTNLFANLNANGVLAIQMPNNFNEPTHTTAANIINAHPEWKDRLKPFLNTHPISSINFYYELFLRQTSLINFWETTYFHILSGDNPVVEWVRGSFLRPLLDQMPSTDQALFLGKYSQEISQHYPQQSDGKTILPFKRLFLIVTKN